MQREAVEKQSSRSPVASKPGNARPESIAHLHPLLRLQRTAGNRAVQRMLAQEVFRGNVHAASDRESVREHLDASGGRVRGTAASSPPAAAKETPASTLQRSSSTPDPANSQEKAQQESHSQAGLAAARSVPRPPDEGTHSRNNGENGKHLDPSIRSFMGARFGQDFSGARIHTDAGSAQ